MNGLDIARRIGWEGERLGLLYRVYHVPVAERAAGDDEPDKFHRGIAPSVKLLHAVVSRLVAVDLSAAMEFVHRWKLTNSPLHLRLWAALSRDARVTPASEVGTKLLSLEDRRFWNLGDYPEIAELRAKRFGELNSHEQAGLMARIRRRPPRSHWPRKADPNRVENLRFYRAIQELRRIEIAGARLPQRDKAWLDARVLEFPDLVQMARLDEGFLGYRRLRWVSPNPDSQYDLLAGVERLKALEAALAGARGGWDDDPSERAADWIRQEGNPVRVLVDLESVPDGGGAYARVWERFGWAHSSVLGRGEDAAQRDLLAGSARVLSLIAKLPAATVRQAIDGISHWVSSWATQVVVLPEGHSVWRKLWPIAVDATNAKQPIEDGGLLKTVVPSSGAHEPEDLDTLNTPAGKLVGVFLLACRTVQSGDQPFREGNSQRSMRNAIEAALGAAGSIVKCRLIEHMPYFLATDKPCTLKNLVWPLLADSFEARTLWRVVGRQQLSFDVIAVLGDAMADRAVDTRLDRDTRRSLVFGIVLDCLHAFKAVRDPAVPHIHIQQMVRKLDDEVRVDGAEAIQRFVRDVSALHEEQPAPPSPEQLFESAAKPFLQQVWPQERSLATPGVSRALAELPAAACEAFAEAVTAVERFLVPFDCWSIINFGLYSEEGGMPKLSSIDTPKKAKALLRLFDLTIGTAEGTVVPHDLADALDQIRTVAPKLGANQVFRRLATAARRR